MFDAVSAPLPATPLAQSAAFARALRAIGQPPRLLPDGSLALHRRWGPLRIHMLARTRIDPTLPETLRAAGIGGPVILSPDAPFAPTGLPVVALVSPCHAAVVDLEPDEHVLHLRLHQKWRNRLRHAQRLGLKVTRQNVPDRADHWLLQADLAQQRSRGYRAWPAELTCAFSRENPGDAKLFTAHIGGEPVAAVLVLVHGNDATYHIGHTLPEGRAASAHTLLIWEAMRWLKRRRVARLDLGVIDTEEGADLARFKLGTGAHVRRLGGTWVYWHPLRPFARPLMALDRRVMRLV